ncbi:hypothetical protein Rhal01_00181 [Rubritalea halochordaticola]|uniref:DUF368 domain-containing protein n=1 Tax=Rubritalea halochordaticola TaxID=714537 RepID=A0ABP9UU71_9BACT
MNLIGVFFKGAAMGAANVVPGVSGGTIAFITGIYERLINALKSFDVQAVKLLFGFKIREFIKHVDFWFLFVLGLGVLTSVATLAKLLEIGFEHYPVYVASLFFGLIAASIWSVAKMVKQWGMGPVIGVLIGCAIAVSLAYAPEANENRSLFYLLICGVVAMCSMIIPGVSGSFVLLLMGNYQLIMIHSVNKLRQGELGEALPVLIPVGVGAVTGLIVLSHILSWLFRKFHDIAVAVITGFVAGSLVIIWPWKRAADVIIKNGEEKVLSYERYFPTIDAQFGIAVAIMLVGVAIMVLTEKLGATRSE